MINDTLQRFRFKRRHTAAAAIAAMLISPIAWAQTTSETTVVETVTETTTTEIEGVEGVERIDTRADTRVDIEPADTRRSLEVPADQLRPESAQDQGTTPTPPAPPAPPAPAPKNPEENDGIFNLFQNKNNNTNSNSNANVAPPTPETPLGIPAAAPLPPNEANNPQARRNAYKAVIDANYDKAVQIATTSFDSQDPFMRANAIEALQPAPSRVLLLARKGIDDAAPVVRFASLMTIGELKFKSLGPAAQGKLNDPSASVRAAAMFACYETGQPVNINALASMLASDSSGVRRNVCLILEQIGDPSATPMIIDMATRQNRKSTPLESTLVRVMAAKTVVALGDDSEIEVIRASAYSSYAEVRVIAIMALGDLEDRVMQPALEQMLRRKMPEQAPEINLAAAYSIARMGSDIGLGTMLQFANMQTLTFDGREYSAEPLRAQAASGLKWIDDPRAATKLAQLLNDPSPRVRIAAADAIIAGKARLNKGASLP